MAIIELNIERPALKRTEIQGRDEDKEDLERGTEIEVEDESEYGASGLGGGVLVGALMLVAVVVTVVAIRRLQAGRGSQ